MAQDALAGGVVGVFDVGYAPAEVDAFAVVGGFDGGGEVFLGVGAGCWGELEGEREGEVVCCVMWVAAYVVEASCLSLMWMCVVADLFCVETKLGGGNSVGVRMCGGDCGRRCGVEVEDRQSRS